MHLQSDSAFDPARFHLLEDVIDIIELCGLVVARDQSSRRQIECFL